jgi:selenide, water dikinase
MTQEPILLTQYARGAGCGCKISPAVLQEINHSNQPAKQFPALLVGHDQNDDAAVYALNDQEAIISTTDFFMPIVDDAFDFGRIAAANAISDVYAMGGSPFMALAILGWPIDKLPASEAARVLEGARLTCAKAGIPLAGGHTIDSAEPFFGLSVNGRVLINQIKTNAGAQVGDLLLLTKPLGVGVLTTAVKRGAIPAAGLSEAIEQMTQLNRIGADLAGIAGVHALTDITGFGLLGHLLEITTASQTHATIHYSQIPVLDQVQSLIAQRIVPDATFRNWNSYAAQVQFDKGVPVMEAFSLLPDPQTNGGLLMAVAPEALTTVREVLEKHGLRAFQNPIGTITVPEGEKSIRIAV